MCRPRELGFASGTASSASFTNSPWPSSDQRAKLLAYTRVFARGLNIGQAMAVVATMVMLSAAV